QHAENICREIINRGKKLRLRTMGVNPSGVTPNLINLMRKAGFAQIDCTPDSASDKMLKNLQKGFSRKKLEKVVRILKEAEMPTMWFFVLGGPGETDETLDETFDFIHRFIDERDLVYLTEGLRIYPKTALSETAIQEGLIKKDESLLTPHFYISAFFGKERLKQRVKEFTAKYHNCLRSVESTPSKEMIQKAIEIRKRENLMDEPMFRTLLRVRKEGFYQ
ncbi:MAG: radical SAM protein, partial [Desulfobacterales bacterium]|nr:radical SAM protein [Desulfobacterales bacterium]